MMADLGIHNPEIRKALCEQRNYELEILESNEAQKLKQGGLFGLGYSTDEGNELLQVYPTDHTEIRQELSKRVEQESLRIDFRANGDPHIGSPKSRFNKNIEAITLLKQLEQEERYATLEEQKVLNLFSSWGGIPQAFDINNKDWQQEYELLQSILSKEEYERARNATRDAFYTPEIIIDAIYKGLEQLGLNNTPHTKEIFEHSIGIGSFLSYAHKYGNNYAFSGIELDDITYRIAKKLYPNQEIFLGGFQNHGFNRDYDAFIGNPPYGEKKIADELNVNLNGLLVCDYFVAKSIQNTKQDGIIAFVVSDRFLDKTQNHVRGLIAKEASFLGAIRLPNNTFKGRANTGVTTDIVFFKKGFDATINKDWIESKSYIQREGKEYNINEYFLNNPQHIAGDLELVTTEYQDYKIICTPNKDKVLTLQLDAFIKSLPKDVYRYRETTYKQDMKIIPKDDSKNKDKIIYVNSFKTEEGKYFYAINTKQEAGKTFVEGLETNTSKDGQSSYIKANIRLSNENIKQDLLNKGEQAKDYVAIVSKDGFHVVLEKDLTHQLQKDQAKHVQQDMQSEKVSTKKQDKGMER